MMPLISLDPLTTDTVADVVFGQPDFVTVGCATSASSLCAPRGVAVDAAGNVYVADRGNSRVLAYLDPLDTYAVADEPRERLASSEKTGAFDG